MTELVIGGLVHHRELGVGQVQEMNAKGITVAFRKGMEKVFQREDIVPLARDGFWYLAYTDPDTVVRELNEHPAKAIALLLRDFPNNEARTADIREQLEEFVSDWPSWWQRTQKLLKQEPVIDTSRSREGVYALAEKPRSYTEELYGEFEALPRFRSGTEGDTSLIINPRKLEIARSILIAISGGERIASNGRYKVQDFVVEAIISDTVAVADRTDLLLRLMNLGWLPDDQARTTLRELCRTPIKLYELDRFAQNRVIDAVLKYVDPEEEWQSLLTAFAAEPTLMRQVCDIYLARGQAERLVQGLWVGLSENLADTKKSKSEIRRWYHALARRFQGLGAILHTIVFDANVSIDWGQLAEHLTRLLTHLNKLDSVETAPEETLQSFVGLWRRSMAFAPLSKQALYLDILLTNLLRVHIIRPVLAAIFSADPPLELADAFVERMSQSCDFPLDSLLECIVDEHWGWTSEAEALSYLITRLHARADVLNWVTDRAIETVQSRREEKVNGLRQRAFQDICEAVRRGEKLELPEFTFDTISLVGLQDFLADLEGQMRTALEETQALITQARKETQLAEERLTRSESSLEELRRGYRQPDREVKFAERVRILRSLSAMTAELERFATHHETGQRELTGVVRRLNNLLGSLGVVTFGTIGDEIMFDPSRHEFVGASDRAVEAVRIIERGYTISDLEGKQRLLKPAKVILVGGDS
jgi:molecular chaperone GrpE (heat shock protein)